jgi:hypothetical protein
MSSSNDQNRAVQHDHVDDVLGAFWEWMRIQEPRWRNQTDHNEYHVSPSIAAGEPLVDATSRRVIARRRSVAKRASGIFGYGIIIAGIAGMAVAWKSSDDNTKTAIRHWAATLSTASSIVATKFPAVSDVEPVFQPASEERPPPSVPALPAASLERATATSQGPDLSPALQHQLASMADDIVAVHQIEERLAVKQDQIAQDVAALKLTEQNVSKEISALSQVIAGHGGPVDNVPRAVPAKAGVHSASAHIQAARIGPALPLR